MMTVGQKMSYKISNHMLTFMDVKESNSSGSDIFINFIKMAKFKKLNNLAKVGTDPAYLIVTY